MTHPRFDQLNASLQTSGLDAVILNPGPTLTHLTGLHFHLMERPVVLLFAQGQDPAIVLPELELQKVASLLLTCMSFPTPRIRLSGTLPFARPCRPRPGWEADRGRPRQLRLLEFRTSKLARPKRTFRCERCVLPCAEEG